MDKLTSPLMLAAFSFFTSGIFFPIQKYFNEFSWWILLAAAMIFLPVFLAIKDMEMKNIKSTSYLVTSVIVGHLIALGLHLLLQAGTGYVILKTDRFIFDAAIYLIIASAAQIAFYLFYEKKRI